VVVAVDRRLMEALAADELHGLDGHAAVGGRDRRADHWFAEVAVVGAVLVDEALGRRRKRRPRIQPAPRTARAGHADERDSRRARKEPRPPAGPNAGQRLPPTPCTSIGSHTRPGGQLASPWSGQS